METEIKYNSIWFAGMLMYGSLNQWNYFLEKENKKNSKITFSYSNDSQFNSKLLKTSNLVKILLRTTIKTIVLQHYT